MNKYLVGVLVGDETRQPVWQQVRQLASSGLQIDCRDVQRIDGCKKDEQNNPQLNGTGHFGSNVAMTGTARDADGQHCLYLDSEWPCQWPFLFVRYLPTFSIWTNRTARLNDVIRSIPTLTCSLYRCAVKTGCLLFVIKHMV